MRFAMLVAAAFAAAWSTVPASAAIVYRFVAVGSASDTNPYNSFVDVYGATSYGFITVNPDPAASTFSGSLLDPLNVNHSVTGSVVGDTLTLNYVRTLNMFPVRDITDVTVSVVFQAGYLQGVFPTSIDFSRAIGGSVRTYLSVCQPRCNGTDFQGSLVGLSASSSSGGSFGGNVSVIRGVPEPTTWLSLILGFGAIGAAMRRRRSVTALA